jgi:hypothetical protein
LGMFFFALGMREPFLQFFDCAGHALTPTFRCNKNRSGNPASDS